MSIFRSKTRGFERDLSPFGIYCLCRLFFCYITYARAVDCE